MKRGMGQNYFLKDKKIWWAFAGMISLLLSVISPLTIANSVEEKNKVEFRIGTASKSGAYYAFVEDLIGSIKNKGFEVVNISTKGSGENLELLADNKLEAALVQNDIAYYQYNDKLNPNQRFGTALPLFPEFFQIIVMKNSGISSINELYNKRIILGAEGSGTKKNAKDVFRTADLIYQNIATANLEESLEKLEAGQVDAICYTSASVPDKVRGLESEMMIISLPREVIDNLVHQSTYYHEGSLELENQSSISTISLMAYLVLAQDAPAGMTKEFMTSLLNNWSKLNSGSKKYQLGDILDLPQAIQRKPTNFHPVAESILSEKGYIQNPWAVVRWLIVFVVITIIFHWLSHGFTRKYDRLGNLKTAKGLWWYRLTQFLQALTIFIAALAFLAAVELILLMIIRGYEANYAIENDVYNSFAIMSISDAAVWLWGWIGGGYTGDFFPRSIVGKILVGFPPLIGLFSVAIFAVKGWRTIIKSPQVEAEKGSFVLPMKDHILICGWNDKAQGIITGLTSRYVPERKDVVVIAEFDDVRPLEKYNFPKGRVYFYRGDSSDHSALENSYADMASAVLILAGDKKGKSNNIGSVLTTLAIKQQKELLFTAAELHYEENIEKFEACNIDALVHGETIIYRLAAQACFNLHAVDLFFDLITHDQHVELYAKPVAEAVSEGTFKVIRTVIRNKQPSFAVSDICRLIYRSGFGIFRKPDNLQEFTPASLRNYLAKKGISLVAIKHEEQNKNSAAMIDSTFLDKSYTNFSSFTSKKVLGGKDVLIYSALKKEDIYSAIRQGKTPDNILKVTKGKRLEGAHSLGKSEVLLIGNLKKCKGIIAQLNSHSQLNYKVLTDCNSESDSELITEVSDLLNFNVLDENLENSTADIVIILASPSNERSAGFMHTYGEQDARTLLIAQHINNSMVPKPRIIAEMIGKNTRRLFKSAGVDVVLPSNLVVERILTKIAYGFGSVCSYLAAILALEDDTHLDSIVLKKEDIKWLDLTYEELFLQIPDKLQLLAIHPKNTLIQERLINNEQDFETHYIASPEHGNSLGYVSQAGDTLLVLNSVKDQR